MNKYSVYLAGPISGIDFEEGEGWRQEAINYLSVRDIDCFSPLRKKDYLKGEGHLSGTFDKWPLSTQRGIYARDRFDCHRADLVLVNLLKAKIVSIGTCLEIAWAAQNNTSIVLIMEENNIHTHPMIFEACPFIVESLDDGLELVCSILLPSIPA